MKRMLTTAVAALALVGGIAQEASAWCKFNFSTGVNLGLETGGYYVKRGGVERMTYPAPGAGGYGGFGGGIGGFGGGYGGLDAGGAGSPLGDRVAEPAPAAMPKAPVSSATPIQSIGYYTYPGYDQQMPTVWWGN